MNLVEKITENQINPNIPEFRVGDTVKVDVKIKEKVKDKANKEGVRERIQVFEGVVTARKGGGVSETFTVHRISSGIGVDRIFPIHSPNIAAITVVRKGVVRRAKIGRIIKESKGRFRIKERN